MFTETNKQFVNRSRTDVVIVFMVVSIHGAVPWFSGLASDRWLSFQLPEAKTTKFFGYPYRGRSLLKKFNNVSKAMRNCSLRSAPNYRCQLVIFPKTIYLSELRKAMENDPFECAEEIFWKTQFPTSGSDLWQENFCRWTRFAPTQS